MSFRPLLIAFACNDRLERGILMAEPHTHDQSELIGNGELRDQVPARPAKHSFWHNTWQVLKTIQARLRFIAILVAIGVLIGSWDTLSNYFEKWTRSSAAGEAVSPDSEYFCPMHPFIVREHPNEKCPICNMDLAKRKKGTGKADPLPPGTVSRVQLTPYRLVLAGAQLSEVTYHRLTKQITTIGSVEFDETKLAHIAARQKGRIVKLYVNYTNQHVEKGDKLALLDVRYSPELTVTLSDLLRARQNRNKEAEAMALKRLRLWDINDGQIEEFLRTGKVNTELTIYAPVRGHVTKKYQREGNYVDEGTPLYDVADLDSVWIEAQVYEADQEVLQKGQPVSATTLGLPNQVFSGTLDFVYPHLDESSRTLTARFHMPNPGHKLRPGMYATVKVQVPPHQIESLSQALSEEWVKENALDHVAHGLFSPAGPLAPTGLGPLLRAATRRAVLQEGLVLAVPDSAVIDTGSLKIVYRESSPNTFEGVAVKLGPRTTEAGSPTVYYPVLRGLQAGDRVVTNGAFLIDAETRLNPAAGSVYYGGSGGRGGDSAVPVRPSTPEDEGTQERKVKAELAKLNAEDRKLAEAQKYCPVLTANRLGSMGPPVKVMLDGQPVFLCCKGCEGKAKANSRETLAKVEELRRAKTPLPKPTPALPQPTTDDDAKVTANLAKLSREDRPLAEAQKYCPITGERLGDPSMGVPARVIVNDQPVFLCCKGCEGEARRDPEKTLAKVKELRAKAKAERHDHK
jgi:Cu(I)/Ag(I) efflux system membrane fusion protein